MSNPPIDELAAKRAESLRTTVECVGGTLTAPTPELAEELRQHISARAERAQLSLDTWGRTSTEQMARLCLAFRTLQGTAGVTPWSPGQLLAWGLVSDRQLAAWHAVLFVLQVWDHTSDWCAVARELGLIPTHQSFAPFNVSAAFATWDEAHRDAFRAWAHLPFFP